MPSLGVIKLIPEHEIFSANKYENANKSWHLYIYKQRNFRAQLCLARKKLQFLVI